MEIDDFPTITSIDNPFIWFYMWFSIVMLDFWRFTLYGMNTPPVELSGLSILLIPSSMFFRTFMGPPPVEEPLNDGSLWHSQSKATNLSIRHADEHAATVAPGQNLSMTKARVTQLYPSYIILPIYNLVEHRCPFCLKMRFLFHPFSIVSEARIFSWRFVASSQEKINSG